MNLEAIVLDIDGTLINSDHVISKKTKEILLKAQDQGVTLVLASGRPTPGMIELAKELELHNHHGLIISYNGASIVDIQDDKVIYERTLEVNDAKRILNHLKKFDIVPIVEQGGYLCVNNAFVEHFDIDGTDGNIVNHEKQVANFLVKEVHDLEEFIYENPKKVLVGGAPHVLQEIHEEMRAPFEDEFSIMFSAPHYFEYIPQDTNKGVALKEVLSMLNINKDNTIAFGDGNNDEDLIKFAGTGVAMGNAVDSLKAVADLVTKTNDEDGIYEILKNYIK